MNLQPISTPPKFYFNCVKCGIRTLTTDECRADLHGPAFKAYYCGPCARDEAFEQANRNLNYTRGDGQPLTADEWPDNGYAEAEAYVCKHCGDRGYSGWNCQQCGKPVSR